MSIISDVYAAIVAGSTTCAEVCSACPSISEISVMAAINNLSFGKHITKSGRGKLSTFALNPEMPYPPSMGKPIQKVVTEIAKESTLTPPAIDYNRMIQEMVMLMGSDIAERAKEHAISLLNTPEFIQHISMELMSRFSVPAVMFNGPESTTLTFPKPHEIVASVDPIIQQPVATVEPVVNAQVSHPIEISSVADYPAPIEISAMQPPETPEITKDRIRLPRVCVTGMKPIEAGAITKEFANTFDLVFWNDRAGDSQDQLRAISKKCNAIFWHVRHCSHTDEKVASEGTATFFRVNGDLSQMKRKLREYYGDLTKSLT